MRNALIVLALLWAGTAQAEPKDDARRHFRAGLEAIQDENFDLALQHFLAAQEAYPHPATIYNIARVYGDLGDFSNALVYYRLYRDTATEGAVDVEPVISAIEARTGAATVVVTTPDEPTTASSVAQNLLTESEQARAQDIAEELTALSEAWSERGATNASNNALRASGILDQLEAPPPSDAGGTALGGQDGTTDPSEINLESLGVASYVEDPYQRSVVTASRYGQDPIDSPSTISVLTREDIRLSGATSIPELLRRVTGVDLFQITAGGADVSIRGYNRELNNKVLILIDGKSTYLDFTGSTFWSMIPVTLNEISRIEIIRGPGSAVYGANAVTGVINILTKVPGEVEESQAQLDVGSIAYRQGQLYTSGRSGEHRYRFTAGFTQHGRWERRYPEQDVDATTLNPLFQNQTLGQNTGLVTGRVDRTFGRMGFASVSGGLSSGNFEYESLSALPSYGISFTDAYGRGDLSWGILHFRTFWNSNNAETGPWMGVDDEPFPNVTRLDMDTIDAELEAPIPFSTGPLDHVLNIGIGYRKKRIAIDYLTGGFEDPKNENHYSFFLNEQMTYRGFQAVGSLRVDAHPWLDLSETVSPRLAAVQRVAPYTSVRATAGTAFRAPNALENYSDFELGTPFDGGWIHGPGSTDLKAERISTFELGFHDESTDVHVVDAVLFFNHLRDTIWFPDITGQINFYDPDPGGFSFGIVPFENAPFDVYGYGLEVEGRIFPTDGMDLYTNIDLQNVEKPDDVLPSFSLPAALKINAGWMYRTPWRTDLTLQGNYVSAMDGNASTFDDDGLLVTTSVVIPSRVILSTRIGIRPTRDENLELAFTGWNLVAGDGWIDHSKGQTLRARVHGSARYTF